MMKKSILLICSIIILLCSCGKTDLRPTPHTILVNSKELNLSVNGNFVKLKAYVLPLDSRHGDIKWRSTNIDVATVDMFGKVCPRSAGKAFIIVYMSNGLKDTCNVNITEL